MREDDNTITFRFFFRGKPSKKNRFLHSNFLCEKEWLLEDSDYDSNLLEYHSENNGICEVILKKIDDITMEELADLFFVDIRKNKDILYVTVLYNEYTDKLVQNYAGKYLNRQKVDLSSLQKSYEVIILHRN